MSDKKYWQGLEELKNSAAIAEPTDEFNEPLPFSTDGKLLDAQTPRRDFLKYLGFSTLAASVAASCEMPVRKVIPYAIKPEDITPGVAKYYASTFTDGGEYCPIVIKTRDGRPIKLEGNPLSSITKGGTSARVQAAVLSLYDKARLRHPYVNGKEATFEQVDKTVMSGLNGKVVLLTSSILSPTTKQVISSFLGRFAGAQHITYDAISYSALIEANGNTRNIPSYRFDKAQTIVGLGCDFLGTWLSPTEFSKQYSEGRKISARNMRMSKHYQIESLHSITGAAADERATCKPSEMGAVAVALLGAINGTSPSFKSQKLNQLITRAAADLKKGNGLVVSGSNDLNVQTVVKSINQTIGAFGATIDNGSRYNYKQGIDSEMVQLVADMNSGAVNALLMLDVNPVYDYFDSKKFESGLSKVGMTVSFAERMDETAQKSKVIAPIHHFLESWGDAEPKNGYYSLQQPGIAPLFKTRAFEDSLLKWSGNTETYGDVWNKYWLGRLGSQENLDKALQDGVIEPAGAVNTATASSTAHSNNIPSHNDSSQVNVISAPVATAANNTDTASAVAQIQSAPVAKDGIEVIVYEKIAFGRGGNWSNNPWLLELPDPITRTTWDNYACVSPMRAKSLNAELTGINQVDAAKRVIKISVNGKEPITLPVIVVPGMHNDVVAVALGFGRHKEVGLAAADLGKNAFPFAAYNGANILNYQSAQVEATEDTYEVAIMQTHMSSEGRPIIHEYTFDEFRNNPNELLNKRKEELGHYAHLPWEDGHGNTHHEGEGAEHQANDHSAAHMSRAGAEAKDLEDNFRVHGTLYPNYEHNGIHWGMSIDLNSCIGCGACVVACQAENNISVVGKKHVMRGQEMHWLRIDRYFAGSPEDPDSIQTIFQPMLCQHCDNAPCENVCPVNATNHSSEGINQMAYNRCIGTKYCANNCPYKVRHFNWMDWNGADSFEDNLYMDGRRDDINDDLTRMVLNPDVTVRSRGVMEKCSFCIQRLQEAKLSAKKENRPVKDGEVKTACQQACASDCIIFGNMNDKTSAIHNVRRKDDAERVFYVLEQLHTLPNINYLSKIRNAADSITGDEKLDGLYQQHI